jgi:hypothetical protein
MHATPNLAVNFRHTSQIFCLEILIFTYTYHLYAPFNMGRFRLDRVCTKHVV